MYLKQWKAKYYMSLLIVHFNNLSSCFKSLTQCLDIYKRYGFYMHVLMGLINKHKYACLLTYSIFVVLMQYTYQRLAHWNKSIKKNPNIVQLYNETLRGKERCR